VTYEDNSEDLTDLTSVHCSQSVTAVGSRHSRDHKQQPTIKHSALEASRLCAIYTVFQKKHPLILLAIS